MASLSWDCMRIKRVKTVEAPTKDLGWHFMIGNLVCLAFYRSVTQIWYILRTRWGHHLFLSQVPPMVKDTCGEDRLKRLEAKAQEELVAEVEALLLFS